VNSEYTGVVERGEGKAAELGYPTVNIALNDASVSGIYAGQVTHGDRVYHAVVFANPDRHILEAHLLDFEDDLYGEEVTIELMEKLRETASFESDGALQAAMEEDVQQAREYFQGGS
jgi:FAD synthase